MASNEKLAPGMVLGRYELLLPVAQGGMATVWAARQRGTRGFNKTVAIKTMLPALSDDAQFEQMFLDEAALAARIHHPNVAEILDLGEQDDVLYIVMEWVEGEALSVIHKAAKRNHAQIPLRLALRIVRQAAAALHAAHELRDENDTPLHLVHRDVSPQNILCTYDGLVKLVDFGVAKAVGRAGGETTAGQLKGKVPYMSPEQARGGVVDRRTDVFALGIVLYKLTTGLHPFLGDNDIATMRNIISRPLIPPRLKNPAFPVEVEQILLRSLQKDPEKRYPNMAEVGQAVERVLGGMGVGDDDLGVFVRSTMGDHGTKRRASIRDAVRAADERFATGQHAIVSLPAPQTIHENVSDAVLTRMSTGILDGPISDPGGAPPPSGPLSVPPSWPSSRPSITGTPSAITGTPAAVGIPSSVPSRPSVEPDSQIHTDQAVVVAVPRGRRSGLVAVSLTVAAAAILLLAAGIRVSQNKRASSTAPAAAAPPVAPVTTGAPSPEPPKPPPPPPTAEAAAPVPTASSAPLAAGDGGAPVSVGETPKPPAQPVAAARGNRGGGGKPRSAGAPAAAGTGAPAPPPGDNGTIISNGKTMFTGSGI
jgi:serine/threonine-protein kinase